MDSKEDMIHLVWCVDDKCHGPLVVAIGSALQCCKRLPVAIHVLTTGLSPDFEQDLKLLCDFNGAAMLEIKRTYMHELDGVRSTSRHIPKEAYLRFLIPTYFPDLRRIIYFDPDVCIRHDLSDLWLLDLGNCICAGADKEWAHDIDYCGQLGLSSEDVYVNSGVLLMDLEKIRVFGWQSKLIEYSKINSDRMPCLDQDVLNVVLKGYIKRIDETWNFTSYEYKIKRSKAVTAAVLHYTAVPKPWNKTGFGGGVERLDMAKEIF